MSQQRADHEHDYARLAYRLQVLFDDLVISGYRDSFRGELGRTQAELLERLCEHGPACAQDLSRALHLPKQHVSRIVDAFARAGMVSVTPSTTDRRSKVIDVTDEGRSLIDRHVQESGERYLALIERLSDDERAELVDAMTRLIRLFEKLS